MLCMPLKSDTHQTIFLGFVLRIPHEPVFGGVSGQSVVSCFNFSQRSKCSLINQQNKGVKELLCSLETRPGK